MPTPLFDDRFRGELATLLRWRRDVRHFDTRALADGELSALIEIACLSPSVGNAQPWRFVRIRSAALRETLADHVDAESGKASQGYDPARREAYRALKLHGIRETPELLVVLCDDVPVAGHGLGRATMAETLRYSCVTAIHTLWLAARARGIGMGWVSILDPERVTALIAVPTGWTMIALLCLGYPADPSETPELERRHWQARERAADRILER